MSTQPKKLVEQQHARKDTSVKQAYKIEDELESLNPLAQFWKLKVGVNPAKQLEQEEEKIEQELAQESEEEIVENAEEIAERV